VNRPRDPEKWEPVFGEDHAQTNELDMSDRILVATRKGLFTLERKAGGWAIAATAFAGAPVTAALLDPDDGAIYAALKHGHFGPKLHRSEDGGATWQDIATPAFPADAAGSPTLSQMWTLETGGRHHPGRLWVGALPAGLFRSDDRGDSWELMRALWDVPERAKWFGGGYDEAGIHSVSPDPRVPGRVALAISCGGVGHARRRQELDGPRQGPDRRLYAARAGGDPRSAGSAPCGALPRRSRRDVDAASQRRLPLDRRRRPLGPAQAAGR
jgi:hypothetical protein